jgi:hypothetical protein
VINSKITQPFKKETACQGRAALITRCSSALPEAESPVFGTCVSVVSKLGRWFSEVGIKADPTC